MGKAIDEVGWSGLPIESGSSTAMSLKASAFHLVKVVLPEPLAPAISVSFGLVTATVAWV
jgi:hypothetical protein